MGGKTMADDIAVNINFNLGKDQTVADIVTLLRKYQPYSKLHRQAADEIEQLRKQAEDREQDFHALKQMFDKMRQSRNEWRNVAQELRHGSWHDAKELYEQVQTGERTDD